MSTIYDVSKLAGVSLATVSRVMNGTSPVREKTRTKVLDAMRSLGYRPNAMAKGLASSKSYSVGILVSELHGPFFGMIMSAIENQLRQHDIHAVFAAGHNSEKSEKDATEFLISKRCDALIAFTESLNDDYIVQTNQKGPPIAIISRKIDCLPENCFSIDNFQGGYMATEYLINKGHKSIAYISGPLDNQISQERFSGHLSALKHFGLEQKRALSFQGNLQVSGGEEGMRQLLQNAHKFTALACANDEMAIGAIASAKQAGLHLPNDISIIGFDDVSFGMYIDPQLTTVKYPINTVAEAAAHWVLNTIYGKDMPMGNRDFALSIVERNSVRSL